VHRAVRFSHLSPPRQALIRLCQSTNYGFIKDLAVQRSEPVLTDFRPLVLIDIKLESEYEVRPELNLPDFVLSAELVRLMSLFDRIEDGKIHKSEIRAGIPRRVAVERSLSECQASSHEAERGS